tara:strand:+ start:416 stop:604 length:189 start_codon:yes stop_codon:yes gene_type:complete
VRNLRRLLWKNENVLVTGAALGAVLDTLHVPTAAVTCLVLSDTLDAALLSGVQVGLHEALLA